MTVQKSSMPCSRVYEVARDLGIQCVEITRANRVSRAQNFISCDQLDKEFQKKSGSE